MAQANVGRVVQVIGPVVDVEFDRDIPPIYQALTVAFTVAGKQETLTLEVQQHLGNGLVRAVAMTTTEGLVRGGEAVDTGAPITVPVGNGVLGRIFNVTGDAVDERGAVEHTKRYTTFGMATDQGKTSNLNGLGVISEASGRTIPEVGITTFLSGPASVFGVPAKAAAEILFDDINAQGGELIIRLDGPTRQHHGVSLAMNQMDAQI